MRILYRLKLFSCRIFCHYPLLIVEALQIGNSVVQTDAELVKTVLNGEKSAFAELVKRYERPVRGVALDVLCDYHSATDVSKSVRFYKISHEYKSFDLQFGHTGIRSVLFVPSGRFPTRFPAISLTGPVISQ
jgi:hypothetical protein